MNYKIIENAATLLDFVFWLPELQADETFYVSLFARKKYSPNIVLKSDKPQLKRFTCNKDTIFQKLRQLECEVGAYVIDGQAVPQEALAVYIMPNPRSFARAAKASLVRFADLITKDYSGYNPQQEVLTEIQKAWSRKVYFDFDFDGIEVSSVLDALHEAINLDCTRILKTRGGLHLLVELAKIDPKFSKTWYNKITAIAGCDVRGDCLLPIPGCVQGGFVPQFAAKFG